MTTGDLSIKTDLDALASNALVGHVVGGNDG